jgi:hypothetical protein
MIKKHEQHCKKEGEYIQMPDWQVTATTIYCDAIDEHVTIMIYNDWTTTCTGYKKYGDNPTRESAVLLKKKAKLLGRQLKCDGLLDYRVTNYRDKLFSEEKISTC